MPISTDAGNLQQMAPGCRHSPSIIKGPRPIEDPQMLGRSEGEVSERDLEVNVWQPRWLVFWRGGWEKWEKRTSSI